MATSSGLFLATIYNQLQLAERKHVARYWSINTAVTAAQLSAHPSPTEVELQPTQPSHCESSSVDSPRSFRAPVSL